MIFSIQNVVPESAPEAISGSDSCHLRTTGSWSGRICCLRISIGSHNTQDRSTCGKQSKQFEICTCVLMFITKAPSRFCFFRGGFPLLLFCLVVTLSTWRFLFLTTMIKNDKLKSMFNACHALHSYMYMYITACISHKLFIVGCTFFLAGFRMWWFRRSHCGLRRLS